MVKSIRNAKHDAILLQGPLLDQDVRLDKVYLRFVDSVSRAGFHITLRTYIIDRKPSWVILSESPPEHRFEHELHRCISRRPEVVSWGNHRRKWSINDYRGRDILAHLKVMGYWILNDAIVTTAKDFVEACHVKAFGYGTAIDPLTWNGPVVEKSIRNATHDAVLLQEPLPWESIKYDKVYIKFISGLSPDGFHRLQRTFIVDRKPTWTFQSESPPENRFEHRSFRCASLHPREVFNRTELKQIEHFCNLYGLNYGECDILRDVDDGRIYLLDANPMPGIYPNMFGPVEKSFHDTPEEFRQNCRQTRQDIVPYLIEPFQHMVGRHLASRELVDDPVR